MFNSNITLFAAVKLQALLIVQNMIFGKIHPHVGSF